MYGHKGEEGGSGYIGGDGVYVCMGTREKREGVGILGEMVCVCVCMGIREKREGVGILGEMVCVCVWA